MENANRAQENGIALARMFTKVVEVYLYGITAEIT